MSKPNTIVIEPVDNGFIITTHASDGKSLLGNTVREICVNEAKLLRRMKELLAKKPAAQLLTED